MNELPEPIRFILRDYCHVEWFEIDELTDDVRKAEANFDLVDLKTQFESIISTTVDITEIVNSLTLNEFESMEVVSAWLNEVYQVVYRY